MFTNRPEYFPGPARNITAIVVDSLNTLPEDQVAVKAQAMQYLRALAPNTRVAIYAIGPTLRVGHDFTGDLEALRARLAKHNVESAAQPVPADQLVRRQLQEAERYNDVVEGYSNDEPDAQADAGRNAELQKAGVSQTMAWLEAVGHRIAGIPGRKNLVWISGGTPAMTQGGRNRSLNDYTSELRQLAQRLATQGVTVYPVRATRPPAGVPGTSTPAPASDKGAPSAIDMLAEVTGGRSFRDTNDLTASADAAANDMRGSYSVGFYVPDSSDNRWHPFEVRINRPGVRVLHRTGYLALAPLKQPASWAEGDWRAAMLNPLGSTAVRFDARAEVVPYGLNVVIQIAADDLYYKRVKGQLVTDLEIGFGERNKQGWTRVRREGTVITMEENPQAAVKPSIVRYSKMWSIEPDTMLVRLIVRDRHTARFGVLDMPLIRSR
jgi:VWFA-related protein